MRGSNQILGNWYSNMADIYSAQAVGFSFSLSNSNFLWQKIPERSGNIWKWGKCECCWSEKLERSEEWVIRAYARNTTFNARNTTCNDRNITCNARNTNCNTRNVICNGRNIFKWGKCECCWSEKLSSSEEWVIWAQHSGAALISIGGLALL